MPLAIWFWVAIFLWLALGLFWTWRPPDARWVGGWMILPFVLFLILGFAVFGGPVR